MSDPQVHLPVSESRLANRLTPFAKILPPHAIAVTFALVTTCVLGIGSTATGQGKSGSNREDPELQPRAVTLTTADRLRLRAFYFPSDKGKQAIPVLLVHEWGGQGSPYNQLVRSLRDAGCAVLVPEYRGHGGSREQTNARGNTVRLDPGAMRRGEVMAVVNSDLEAAKRFLKDENNAGRLNLNALTVIGIREGAILAAHWSIADWRFPSIGAKKQGQDVKGIVLVSPERNFMGIAIDPALGDRTLIGLPVMVVAGADSSQASETERIVRRLAGGKDRARVGKASELVELMPSTNLSGARLINDSPDVIPSIVRFVTTKVSASQDVNPWIERP